MSILTRVLSESTKVLFRDLDSATPKGLSYLLGGTYTASGKQVSKRSSLGLSAVYHAVDLISSDYASLDTIVYHPTEQGRDILTSHNTYRLLNFQPNHFQTPFEYKRMMAVNRLMYGNAYAIKDYNGGAEIHQLLPVHPDNVSDITEMDGELFYHIKDVALPIPGRDMIHVKDLSIENNSFKGMSRIEYCAEDIGRAMAINEHASGLFRNNASIGAVIESELGAIETKEQRESLENSLRKREGSENAHRSLVLPSGFKLSQGTTRFNAEETQFIQTKIQTVEEAAQIFNLPLNKMRMKENGTSYNSQEQSNIEYVADTLRPFCKAFQQEYNLKAFNTKDWGEVFVRDSLESRLKGDMAAQTAHIVAMIQNGVYNVNDARDFLGKNKIGVEGDMHYIQSNQMELGQDPIKNKE